MYTVMNRIPVPEAGAAAFEERFAASMRETLPAVPGLVGSRLPRPQQEGGAYVAVMEFTSADVETFETVVALGA